MNWYSVTLPKDPFSVSGTSGYVEAENREEAEEIALEHMGEKLGEDTANARKTLVTSLEEARSNLTDEDLSSEFLITSEENLIHISVE